MVKKNMAKSMRSVKSWVIGNWKMHHTIEEASCFFEKVSGKLSDKIEVGIAPSACVLGAFHGKKIPVKLGAQNMHFEAKGAFTGELSPAIVKECASFVLVGHSERRTLFHETDEIVAKKAHAAIQAGLLPVICIGETLEERELGKALEVVERQLKIATFGIEDKEFLIAYEPVWAIGTGKTATAEDAEKVHAHIASLLQAPRPILYGGSVKPSNISELTAQPNIHGALVGGASLDAESFIQLTEGVCS